MYEKIFNALCNLPECQNNTIGEIKLLAEQYERDGWAVDVEGDLIRPDATLYYGENGEKPGHEEYIPD